MREYVRNCALAASAATLAMTAVPATANEGIYLPAAPRGAGGEDSIETAGGTRCRQSMNANGAYLDIGVAGTAAEPLDNSRQIAYSRERDSSALVYARVTIPLGKQPPRIDCTRIFEMEIARLREELALLRMAAE